MEGYVAKNGIPKFAMDDVEIVLDELCSGYDNATECRMRKELFDHYQSAFDDAVGDGWVEEVAHKKVLQDLGWETTLMVGRVCKGMGIGQRKFIHWIIYGKDLSPWYGILVFAVFYLSLTAIILHEFEHEKMEWPFFYLTALALPLAAGHAIYQRIKMRKVSTRELPKRQEMMRYFQKDVYFEIALFMTISLIFLMAFLFWPNQEIFMGMTVNFLVLALSSAFHRYRLKKIFRKKWNQIYPQDKLD